MGKIKLSRTRTTKSSYRKSKMVKDSSGHYHCPTCGAFKSTGKKKKKK